MKKENFCAGALLALALGAGLPVTAAAAERDWNGNINLLLGTKVLKEDDWDPVDEHGELGLEFDFKKKDSGLSFAMDFLKSIGERTEYYSYLGDVEMRGETSEVDIGVRKIWDNPRSNARPFIGGGLCLANAKMEASIGGSSAFSASGSGTGVWFNAGVYWLLGDSFNLGLEFRRSAAEVEISGSKIEAGGSHLGLLLGYHWGGDSTAKQAYSAPIPPAPSRQLQPAYRPSYEPAAPAGAVPAARDAYDEREQLELEKQKLELERQKLQLEKEKLEFEKQKRGK